MSFNIYTWYKQCFVILLALGRSTMERGDDLTPILERALELLCPYNTVCSADPPMRVSNNSDFTGCCSDCSCDESCGLIERCCLPEMDIHRVVDRSHQKCLISSTFQNISLKHMSYNMVVDAYPDGKGDYCGDKVTTCGEDELASPIGAFYPVFSKRTRRIYKNIRCARCHGLKVEDVIKWEVLLQCDNIKSDGIIHVDVSAALNSLEKPRPAPNCNYVFYYPGPSIDIKYERCMGQVEHVCIDNFYIDSRLNMTKEEIRSTCFEGLKSPIYDMFINTFCFICSKPHSNIIENPRLCRNEDTPMEDIPDSDFTSLIHPEVLQTKQGDGADTHEMVACSKRPLNKEQTSEYCRPILCSTGRLRIHGGKCEFPGKTFSKNLLTLTVELKPLSVIYESDLFSNGSDFKSLFSKHSPWSLAWEIGTIVYKSRGDSHSRKEIAKFLVFMRYTIQRRDIAHILPDIEVTLTLPWLINFNNFLTTHTQAHSKYTRFYKVGEGKMSPVLSLNAQLLLTPYITNSSQPLFTILVHDWSRMMGGLAITKMFFCDQVQLKFKEFEMNLKNEIFYHKLINRTFYRGEFSYVYDDNGNGIPRVCLEDSGFTAEHSYIMNNSNVNLFVETYAFIISFISLSYAYSFV